MNCVRLEIEYDNGTIDVGMGETARQVWAWIESAQSMLCIHGGEYRGPRLETRKTSTSPKDTEIAALKSERETLRDAVLRVVGGCPDSEMDEVKAAIAQLERLKAERDSLRAELQRARERSERVFAQLTRKVSGSTGYIWLEGAVLESDWCAARKEPK